MTLLKIAAVVGAGFLLTTAPALAGRAVPTRVQLAKSQPQVEQIRYRRNVDARQKEKFDRFRERHGRD